jgi:hypothetical protein
MSGEIPNWELLASQDSYITANPDLNFLIVKIIKEPSAHLNSILEHGIDVHPASDTAHELLEKMIRKHGNPQDIYTNAVLFRAFEHVGVQLQKLAFPTQNTQKKRAKMHTKSPVDLLETAREFFSAAAEHYQDGMENIWTKLRERPINPEIRAYEWGQRAIDYLSTFGTQPRTHFAHTIKELHSTMIEYLLTLQGEGQANLQKDEFQLRPLIRKAYRTAGKIDDLEGNIRSAPQFPPETLKTPEPGMTFPDLDEQELTIEADPRPALVTEKPTIPGKTIEINYDQDILGEPDEKTLSEKILSGCAAETLTMPPEGIPDVELERIDPDADTREMPPIDVKAETVQYDDKPSQGYDPNVLTVGQTSLDVTLTMSPEGHPEIPDITEKIDLTPDRTGTMDYDCKKPEKSLPDKTAPMHLRDRKKNYARATRLDAGKKSPLSSMKKIPEMTDGPRFWTQEELMEHYFPFLLRDEEEDQPGRPFEVCVPETLSVERQGDAYACTVRFGQRGEYTILVAENPILSNNYVRGSAPLTTPKPYVTTHFKEEDEGKITADVCIGGVWEQIQFRDPNYEVEPLTLGDLDI